MSKKKDNSLFNSIQRRLTLSLVFAAASFLSMVVVLFLLFTSIVAVWHLGLFSESQTGNPFLPLFLIFIIYLIVGFFLSLIFSHHPLKPILQVISAFDKIAKGDYSVRLSLKGPEEIRDLGEKFNDMAQELGSVELLGRDFVNNFSHEFKTPIVSIRGFARMLKLDNLSEAERDEYLDIIIEESERLTSLSTNVLNLSKLEQQTILTNKNQINISEQIRRTISMMDSKWPGKQIEYQFDCEDVFAEGNEELLKQVWINLLDNAIKFSPANGRIHIETRQNETELTVRISNQGDPIPPEAAGHIFDKFYQGDTSHTARGNGLGLAIVRRIMELHGGEVSLISSDQEQTIFQVQILMHRHARC